MSLLWTGRCSDRGRWHIIALNRCDVKTISFRLMSLKILISTLDYNPLEGKLLWVVLILIFVHTPIPYLQDENKTYMEFNWPGSEWSSSRKINTYMREFGFLNFNDRPIHCKSPLIDLHWLEFKVQNLDCNTYM